MLDSQHLADLAYDPPPRYPSDAEIALAERLRHEIEERYLAPDSRFEQRAES